jgi:hypothetical protein
MMRSPVVAAFLLALVACGGDETQDEMPDAPTSTIGTWSTLIDKDWALQPVGSPNSEDTSNLQLTTLERDIYVAGIRPIAPPGTHHTLLFRGLAGTNAIFASGIGTGELMFPEGKGLILTKGTTLGLQLHIYNTSDEVLSGRSGVEVLEIDPSKVTEEVDFFLPGPQDLDLPPGVSTHSGTCTARAKQTLFALVPHMHQYGAHFKTTLTINGVDQVLHDDSYSFEHQIVKTFTPITLNAGDKIKTECTWNNTTGANIGWGESTDTEMCFSMLYRYPKQNNEFCEN